MSTTAALNLFLVCSALLTAASARRVKTVDLSNNGDLCDTATEQYLQVEGFDYYDKPKFTMTWSQKTGQCGEELDPSELKSWSATYDSIAGGDPSDGTSVQLNLFICSPFGEYELELDIESENEAGTTDKRVSWEVENGPDEYHIWDTLNTELRYDEAYSPTTPGVYTWPIEGGKGYYSVLYAGPLPPLECSSSVPSGTEYEGCFVDSSSSRLFDSDSVALTEKGPEGMTTHICSTFCLEYDYFGVGSGSECYCGTAEEFMEAVTSDQCGLVYESLCTGDATTACGGSSAISVFHRTGGITPPPSPSPSPVDTTLTYTGVGCYEDDKNNRVMSGKTWANTMSAEICFGICNNGVNTHFGTEFSKECWCAESPDLTTNGEQLNPAECDMLCASATDGELCGGYDRITAYEIVEEIEEPTYLGCYRDARYPRAMDGVGKYTPGGMTNELCIEYCGANGFAYAGSQYAKECWCGDSFDMYGAIDEENCSSPCQGDADQICGGNYALSVYQV